MTDTLFPLSALLPHRPPMVLLDGIREVSETRCIAHLRVAPEAWYLNEDGDMPAWFGLEIMAQAVSTVGGRKRASLGRSPQIGYLLGTRRFHTSCPSFPVGSDLEAEVQLVFLDEAGPSAFECELRHNGVPVAHARLKVVELP